jgi:hypothetical protein
MKDTEKVYEWKKLAIPPFAPLSPAPASPGETGGQAAPKSGTSE